ncbi:OLC1v1006407C1 [Oldenlandia corymbosa var. corymbosa]|uniref:OLC1v1006407C1 n=1 Tax=Oldenlandia corymbosa var. corymbosa TaxID=529605 RepID=A0AAV1DH01_OLDCO|nr:OLC1v1006407C1 [Oldenlandia corymbosa var. corymbosa]
MTNGMSTISMTLSKAASPERGSPTKDSPMKGNQKKKKHSGVHERFPCKQREQMIWRPISTSKPKGAPVEDNISGSVSAEPMDLVHEEQITPAVPQTVVDQGSTINLPSINKTNAHSVNFHKKMIGRPNRKWKRSSSKSSSVGFLSSCHFSAGGKRKSLEVDHTHTHITQPYKRRLLISQSSQGLEAFGTAKTTVSGRLVKNYKPSILFMMESKASKVNVLAWQQSSIFNNSVVIDPVGLSGGLCLFWVDGVQLSVLYQNANIIVTKVKETTVLEWLAIFLYSPPSQQDRAAFWSHLNGIIQGFRHPSILLGDFNQILDQEDKFGGRPVRPQDTRNIQQLLSSNDLEELKHLGYWYTWTNKKQGHEAIFERLDRAFINKQWLTTFNKAIIRNLPIISSDHGLILVGLWVQEPAQLRSLLLSHFSNIYMSVDSSSLNSQSSSFLTCLLANNHTKRKVISGKDIPISANWIPDTQNPIGVHSISAMSNLTVDRFIHPNGQWKIQALRNFFPDHIISHITGIFIDPARLHQEDKLHWTLTDHGTYTVKSGYQLAINALLPQPVPSPATQNAEKLAWKRLWNSRVQPKHKFLFWRAILNALSTRSELCKRGVQVNPLCPRCGWQEEDSLHLFFKCEASRDIWALAFPQFGSIFNSTYDSLHQWFIQWTQSHPAKEEVDLFLIISWRIWLERNDKIWRNQSHDPAVSWRLIQNEVTLHKQSLGSLIVGRPSPNIQSSLPQRGPTDSLVIFDDPFSHQTRKAVGAWKILSHHGMVMQIKVVDLSMLSPFQAQAMTCLLALKEALHLGITRLQVYTDCEALTGDLRSALLPSEAQGVVSLLVTSISLFRSCSLIKVSRQDVVEVHNLAFHRM